MHECPFCGYASRYKCALKAHLNRKRPCSLDRRVGEGGGSSVCPADTKATSDVHAPPPHSHYKNRRTRIDGTEIRCDTCGSAFNHKSALCRHRKACAAAARQRQKGFFEYVHENDFADMKQKYDEICELLKGERSKSEKHAHITINNTHINQVNAFGREQINDISQDLLDSCLRRTSKGLIELVDHIRFENDQNRNVRASIVHPNIVEYHDGTDWQYGQKNRIVKKVVDQGHEIMQEHFEDNSDRLRKFMSNAMFDFVCSWLRKMERNNHAVYTDVMAEVYLLILNRSRSSDADALHV